MSMWFLSFLKQNFMKGEFTGRAVGPMDSSFKKSMGAK